MMMNRVIKRTVCLHHVRLVTTSTSTSSTTLAVPVRKYATPSSTIKPRAPYVRKTLTPIAKVSATEQIHDDLVDPTASDTSELKVIKVARKSTPKAIEPVESMREEAMMDSEETYDPLPEVPLIPSSRAKTTSASVPKITSNSEFPSVPFPLAADQLSVTSTSVVSKTMTDNVSIRAPPEGVDWTTSFHGMSAQPFSQRAAELLMKPLRPDEIEIKPDGLLYLPEILYRRVLNQAFGPGGWGMVPRGEMTVLNKMVSREWGLIAGGRLVSVARGEQLFFDPAGLPTATEGCKSNALMRCCKDLGIASELWDPGFIRVFKSKHCVEAWTEHASTKKRQKRWRMKKNTFEYPLKETTGMS